jgi:hypothetical protein
MILNLTVVVQITRQEHWEYRKLVCQMGLERKCHNVRDNIESRYDWGWCLYASRGVFNWISSLLEITLILLKVWLIAVIATNTVIEDLLLFRDCYLSCCERIVYCILFERLTVLLILYCNKGC